ncbi:MAG: alpha-mannosidase [Lentisphaeria bacterium]|nr:alpha-mannosidase [Lentisphaeria bacterium]
MHDKIFEMYHQRVKILLDNELPKIYQQYIPLTAEYGLSDEPVKYADRDSLKFQPAAEGMTWGHEWQSAWIHVTAEVPESFAGKELCLQINTGSEALLFENGIPRYSFTNHSAFNESYYKDRYILDGTFSAGARIDYWIEAAATGMFGERLPGAMAVNPPAPLGTYSAAFKYLRLCVFDRELWNFMLDMKTAESLLTGYDKGHYRQKQLLFILNKALDIYAYKPENASAARNFLKEKVFSCRAADSALTAYSVGHSHLDIAWLWPVRESIRKAARTFASQLYLMEKYPDYVYGSSQPQLYQMVKEHYPELYEQVKERVKEGRWELQGGMWVEADSNVISGESIVRQFLHGKNFFMDEFGVEVKNHWLPDVFGYSAALPQFIKKSGCDYFMTQKISWSKINHFPHHTFRWKGIDGTEVLTHFLPEDTYNADAVPEQRIKAQNHYFESGYMPAFLSLFGIGDGGCGPKEEHIESCLRMADLEGCPKSRFAPAKDFFELLGEYSDQLPVWNGELYLELHRGTLTTQAATKRNNRKCEQALIALEFLASCLPAEKYPAEQLDRAWKNVLLNQFHDIIPGSSIHQVYDTTKEEYAAILDMVEKEICRAGKELFSEKEDCAVLVNSLPYSWKGTVELPAHWAGASVTDHNGNLLPVQVEGEKCYAYAVLPPSSFTTVVKGPAVDSPVEITRKNVLENELIRYEFNEKGQLIRAFDKTVQKEVLTKEANVLSVYYDRPMGYADAWDIEIYYPRDFKEHPECISISDRVSGAVRSYIDFTFKGEKCVIKQRAVLSPGSRRLDFETDVDWQEHRAMLRTAFPVNVSAENAVFDIQYSFIKRPTCDNTSWDEAKFEVCGQRYADLSSDDYGAALLNDCKYGYRVKGSTLDLNLLRSPSYPDYSADRGTHTFTYSFLPHKGDHISGGVLPEAAALNRKPLRIDGAFSAAVEPPCTLTSDSVTMEVVKKAEKDDTLIVRLVENHGKHASAELKLRDAAMSVTPTDLIEWGSGEEISSENGTVFLDFAPFEIKTLRLKSPEK